jgi:hypothetical protein
MAARVVAIRRDMYLAGSLFEMFRLLRIELNEGKGGGELAVLSENALIVHGIVA